MPLFPFSRRRQPLVLLPPLGAEGVPVALHTRARPTGVLTTKPRGNPNLDHNPTQTPNKETPQ